MAAGQTWENEYGCGHRGAKRRAKPTVITNKYNLLMQFAPLANC